MTGQDNIIELRGVDKSFEDTRALEGIDLSISNGEFLTLLGPSGCGKTTILRILSGFETPDQGDVSIGGQRMNDVPPERRQVNTVFQNYALFPHMTVRDNVAFGLRMQSCPKGEIEGRVLEALRMVHLEQYADRRPHQLSGGQQQRVAIARALATKPKILLCDEATSALDPQSTQSILGLIRDIHDRLGITVIVITHQMSVVEQICTRVAILDGGEVAEEGKVSEVFAAPQSQAAKRLVYPEGYEQPVVRFDEGKMLRVVFNGAKATKTPLIAQMALDCGITASILGASTKGIGEKAYGNMLLGIPGGDAELQRAMDYLRSIPDIFVEEVDGHV